MHGEHQGFFRNRDEMKIILAVLFLMLMVLGLCCQPKENNQLTEREYAVYLAVIGERPKNLIVVDEKVANVFGEISSGKLPDLVPGTLQETIDDYALKNLNPIAIPENFPFKDGYQVIRKDDRGKLISELDGHYLFSRVGFSKNGTQAFVYFTGGRSGAFYLLSNNNGVWTIETKSESWKS